jgi:hypothetical protein
MTNFSVVRTQSASTVSIYPNYVPDFVATALEALYGNLHASLATLKSHSLRDASTYVRWDTADSQPESIFIFRKLGQSIRVINEGMRLNKKSVEEFCEYMFGQDEQINRIDFHAVAPPPQRISRPHLAWACTEDIVVTLPKTEQDYLDQLGKSTRKSIKKNLSRAQRLLPNFNHSIHSGSSVTDSTLRQVVRFNHSRMAGKEKLSALNDEATNELISLMRSHGVVGLIASDQGLGAGTLACRFGEDIFSIITAHDPTYDSFGLGTLSRHLMIVHCIELGAKRFHLLGGNLSSKRSALGIREKLDHLTIYRTPKDMLRYPKATLQLALNELRYHLHRWLEDQSAQPEHSPIARLLNTLRLSIRATRRWLSPRATRLN